MIYWYERTKMLLGEAAIETLCARRVVIFGIGGVGSYVAESLARCNINHLTLVDSDDIALTNINRQIHANHKTIGQAKVDAMKERILDINPDANVTAVKAFVTADNLSEWITDETDFVVDAIDTVTSKLAIIEYAKHHHIQIISSMGAGNKIYPERLELADISQTSICPLAKVMRKELKKRNITDLTVCFSKEPPRTPESSEEITSKRRTPASISFVPSAAGLIISGFVIRTLLSLE